MATPHVRAVIDLGALAQNVSVLKNRVGKSELMAVVKAGGYGHGLVESGKAALAGGAQWLATALIQEALTLRESGIDAPILAWLYTSDDQFSECIQSNIDLAVNSVASATAIADAAQALNRTARVHIKVDTGLGRNGVMLPDLPALLRELNVRAAAGHITVVGIMSHFAYADQPTNSTIAMQIENFMSAVDQTQAAGFELQVKHLANSAATLGLPQTYLNLVRPGVAIYGVSPGGDVGSAIDHELKPVMSLRSSIALLKEVPAGTGLSYAHQYYTERDTRVALIPAGYADGIPRAATNKGPVLIGGEIRTIAGRVCMDQFVLDVGGLDVELGDEVVLFGDPAVGAPSLEAWADAADTINYEIITRIGPRVAREYINVPW